MTASPARRREEQGRVFWAWLLTVPIIGLLLAGRAFAAPWPSPMTQRIAMVLLAFPVIFVVGEPLFAEARAAESAPRRALSIGVVTLAIACYGSGTLALIVGTPPTAGAAALVVSTYLTIRYLAGWY